jgi:transposase
MIHKIKAMYDEGRGSSLRAIAAELKISRNTVRKYLRMSAEEITAYREGQRRERRLDVHHGSAVKVLRKLTQAQGELGVSGRSVRRYLEGLKATVGAKAPRCYEPVLDMVPGVQCQVDGGEVRGVWS